MNDYNLSLCFDFYIFGVDFLWWWGGNMWQAMYIRFEGKQSSKLILFSFRFKSSSLFSSLSSLLTIPFSNVKWKNIDRCATVFTFINRKATISIFRLLCFNGTSITLPYYYRFRNAEPKCIKWNDRKKKRSVEIRQREKRLHKIQIDLIDHSSLHTAHNLIGKYSSHHHMQKFETKWKFIKQ